MKIHKCDIPVSTGARFQLVDITSAVAAAVCESGVTEGFALVFSPHATAAVRVNENEPRLHQDMEKFFRGLAVPEMPYRHDADTVDGRPNAWGHLVSMLMGVSAAIPVSSGRLEIGAWQSVFFVELDGPRPGRKVLVRVYGE